MPIKFGVSEGQMVKVTSRRGTVEAKAHYQKSAPGNDLYELPFCGRIG
jgi:anaerobic selenocysteine-containing dehydrogenase